MSITRKLAKALSGAAMGFADGLHPSPQRFKVAGRTVRCSHCEGRLFFRRDFRLRPLGLKFFGATRLGEPEAVLLCCAVCSHVEWFALQPEVDDTPAE
jgi:hypothetical protein